jgi:hypothetical protein
MNLDTLKPRIDGFVEFARKFPAPYRPAIVTYLLQVDAAERGIGTMANTVASGSGSRTISPSLRPAPSTNGNINPAIIEVAAEINASPEVVDRRLVTVVDDRPEIRWKSEDVSKAKRQVEYAIVFTYVLEKLGEEGARIEELRNLCMQKRSYDMANFMANFKRQRDLLQLADVPGGKEQEVVLTGLGRQRARQLLANAVENLAPISTWVLTAENDPARIGADAESEEQEEEVS